LAGLPFLFLASTLFASTTSACNSFVAILLRGERRIERLTEGAIPGLLG
jgi:hypothetical protein